MTPSLEKLEVVLCNAVREAIPRDGIETLVDGLRDLIVADLAVLYMLRLDQSEFLPYLGDSRLLCNVAHSLAVDIVETKPNHSFADSAIQKQEVIWRFEQNEGGAVTQIAAPVKRGTSVIGLLFLQRNVKEPFSNDQISVIRIVTGVMLPLVEKQGSLELLQSVQRPIDFQQNLNEYLQDLLLLISSASGMPMIAIRELEEETRHLKCIATFGLSTDLSAFDLEPADEYAPFKEAIDTRKPVAISDARSESVNLAGLLGREELKAVRSFVVAPILVGDAVLGTLSFAAGCRYNYSTLEITGFETVANVIGTSISNHRNAHKVSQLYQIEGELAVGLTALEVAQAARHEARNVIESINTELANLKFQITKSREYNSLRAVDTIDRIYENSQEIARVLDKIRDVSRPPKRELCVVSLKQIILEASALVNGKISKERVSVHIDGRDVELEAYPERLRHAFLNLFLNSLDAFGTRKKESNRLITLQLNPTSLKTDEVHVRYADNATGIDPTRLKNPSARDESFPIAELIFQPGVTSKQDGSGHGLFLVRRIIAEHKGSINLVDYRNGVVFDITLSKRLVLRPR